MADLQSDIDDLALETSFSGAVSVRTATGKGSWAQAWGLAHRGLDVPCTTDTRFAMASGTKGFTALAVLSLIVDGTLTLDKTARSVLGSDLPLIDDRVTVEQLLSHRSGIGDYFDEDVFTDTSEYAMQIPVNELDRTENFLKVLDGFPQKFEPGTDFSYCNGGFVVLALIAERASGTAYHDLVQQRVLDKAGMTSTAYLRSDESSDAAVGYLDADGMRTNVLHLPVRGNGDGGSYTTLADMHRFWDALCAGAIIPDEWVATMTRPRSTDPDSGERWGLGIRRLPEADILALEGCDTGVSFRSVHDPVSRVGFVVLSNTTQGAWPLVKALEATLY